MKYLIFGADPRARAVTHYLLQHEDTEQVIVLDANGKAAETPEQSIHDDRVSTMCHKVFSDSESETRQFISLADVVISCLPGELNHNLCRLVAQVKDRHFVDLGGSALTESRQRDFSDRAARSGMTMAPAQGIAPGAVSVLTAYLMKKLGGEHFDAARIFVGGIPRRPIPTIGYSLASSVHEMFNEYLEMAEVLRNGRRQLVESISDIMSIDFPAPYGGVLEAAVTSGGLSTLTRTFEGKVDTLEYRTLRWPGHWKTINTLKSLGFLSMLAEDGLQGITPRTMTERVFDRNMSRKQEDLLALRIVVQAGKREATFTMAVKADPNTGFSAIHQVAGFSATHQVAGFSAGIVARMIATGRIQKRGTITTELDVPPDEFLNEWQSCGFSWHVRET